MNNPKKRRIVFTYPDDFIWDIQRWDARCTFLVAFTFLVHHEHGRGRETRNESKELPERVLDL